MTGVVLVSACGAGAGPEAPPSAVPRTPAPASPLPSAVPSPTAAPTATPHPAIAVIERYLAARARVETATVEGLACSAWRAQARTESAPFRSMNAELVDLACAVAGSAEGATLVQCQGKIVTHYGGETRDWPLDRFVYRVVSEDGAWKMCGYK